MYTATGTSSPVNMTTVTTLEVYNCSATANTVYGTSPVSNFVTAQPSVQACLTGSCCWGALAWGGAAVSSSCQLWLTLD